MVLESFQLVVFVQVLEELELFVANLLVVGDLFQDITGELLDAGFDSYFLEEFRESLRVLLAILVVGMIILFGGKCFIPAKIARMFFLSGAITVYPMKP